VKKVSLSERQGQGLKNPKGRGRIQAKTPPSTLRRLGKGPLGRVGFKSNRRSQEEDKVEEEQKESFKVPVEKLKAESSKRD